MNIPNKIPLISQKYGYMVNFIYGYNQCIDDIKSGEMKKINNENIIDYIMNSISKQRSIK